MHTKRTCVGVTLLGAMLLTAGAAQAQAGRGEQKRSREIVIGEAVTVRSPWIAQECAQRAADRRVAVRD